MWEGTAMAKPHRGNTSDPAISSKLNHLMKNCMRERLAVQSGCGVAGVQMAPGFWILAGCGLVGVATQQQQGICCRVTMQLFFP